MIVVTTPAGQIGSQVLRTFSSTRREDPRCCADPSSLPDSVRGRIELVNGSHGDAAVVDKAFEGADAVFWLVPPDPQAESVDAAHVGFTRPAAEAFKKHGVQACRGSDGVRSVRRGPTVRVTSRRRSQWTI